MTPKQQQFVAEYLVDLNATQAAIRAGYSERTARQQGARLLTNVDVQTALSEAQAQRLARVEVTADEVLRLLKRRATSSLKQVARWGVKEIAIGYDDEGRKLPPEQMGDAVVVHYANAGFLEPVDSDDLTDDEAAGIAEVTVTKEGAIKLKMHSQDAALALLARHAGVVAKDGEGGSPVQVNVFVDRPPPETREQWLERVRRERGLLIEAEQASTVPR